MKALISASLFPDTATSLAIATCAIVELVLPSSAPAPPSSSGTDTSAAPFFGGSIALPLDEAAADRVVLLFEEHLVARHQLAGHRVRMREVALRRVVDDVLERRVEGLVDRASPGRSDPACRAARRGRCGSTVAGSLPMMPASDARSVPWPLPVALRLPNRCTFSAVAFASWSAGQLGAALVEVVGDAHRPDGVRARWAGTDLVELVDGRHHRALGLLDDVQLVRESAPARCGIGGAAAAGAAACCCGVGAEHPAMTDTAPTTGAAHHEGATIDARRQSRRLQLFGGPRSGPVRRSRDFRPCHGEPC